MANQTQEKADYVVEQLTSIFGIDPFPFSL